MSSAWGDEHRQHLSVCSHTLNNWWLLSSLSGSLLDGPLRLSSASIARPLFSIYLHNFLSLLIMCHTLSPAVFFIFSPVFYFFPRPPSALTTLSGWSCRVQPNVGGDSGVHGPHAGAGPGAFPRVGSWPHRPGLHRPAHHRLQQHDAR